MGEVDELVASARRCVGAIVRVTPRLLEAGADPDRVHHRYLSAAFALWEEFDIRAVMAGGADAEAITHLRLLAGELQNLADEAQAELEAQTGDGREL